MPKTNETVSKACAPADELRLIIGTDTSRRGIELIFDALQNEHLNRCVLLFLRESAVPVARAAYCRRFAYVLLERLLCTIFAHPGARLNLKLEDVVRKLHRHSPRVLAARAAT